MFGAGTRLQGQRVDGRTRQGGPRARRGQRPLDRADRGAHPEADNADRFLAASSRHGRVRGTSLAVDTEDASSLWEFGDVTAQDGLITQMATQEDADGWGCQHALAAVSNLTVETWVCAYSVGRGGADDGHRHRQQRRRVTRSRSYIGALAGWNTPELSASSSARMTCTTALINARWVNACGKLPRCLPVRGSISSA